MRSEGSAEERKSELESVAVTTDSPAGLYGNDPLNPSQTSRSDLLCPGIGWGDAENLNATMVEPQQQAVGAPQEQAKPFITNNSSF